MLPPDQDAVKKAVFVLKKGGVIAFPTETSYGLGASIYAPEALERIYEIKKRPKDKPLLVIISSLEQLDQLAAETTPAAKIIMERFWPGPVTLLFKARRGLHQALTGNTGKVGVRLSSNPWAKAIVSELGFPITATSCNLAGEPPANSPAEVKERLGEHAVDYVCPAGKTPGGLPSTIVDTTTCPPTIVRPGAVDPADILRECGKAP